MAKSRRHGRRSHSRSRRSLRKQHGGGDGAYGFTGPAGVSAGGVPFESRGPSYTQCGWDVRPAAPDVTAFKTVQFGGRRRFRQQRGGGCGCMAVPPMQRGGGAGTGGFGFNLSNDLGKVYTSLDVRPCPPPPHENQIGGAAVDDLGIVSYKSGYGFGPESVYSTASAHYLDKLPYDRTVMTGGRRSRKGSRSGRKSRRTGRKH